MHEISLANSVIDLVNRECERLNRHDLKEIEIEIGELAGVNCENFEYCLEIIKKKSQYSNAKIRYINIPGEASCIMCGTTFSAHKRFPQCPKCGSAQVGIIHGLEFKVKSLIF